MEKHRSTTFLVALALLGSFVAISVEAQGSVWQSKGAPPPPPQAPQNRQIPQVQPPPPQRVPQYEQGPQTLQPPPPKAVPRPQEPQVSPPQPQFPGFPPIRIPQPYNTPQVQAPPKMPQHHNVPQVQPPPKMPQHHNVPQVQPPPKMPQHHNVPQVQPPPKMPQHHNVPQVQPPPKMPQHHDVPQVQPPPKMPQHHVPQVQPPPKMPQHHNVPPPKYHNPPQIQPGPPPTYPKRPQNPYVPPPKYHNPPQTQPGPPPVSPERPQNPYVPPPKYHNPPQTQPGPPPVSPERPQNPYVPPPKYHNPPQTQPGPPPTYPERPQNPYVPPPKYHNPPQTQPGPPPVSPERPQNPYVPPPKYHNPPQTQPGPPPTYPERPQNPYVPPPKYHNPPQTQPGPPRFISPSLPIRQPQPHQPPKFAPLHPRSFSNYESPQEPKVPQPQQPHQPTSPQEPSIHQPKQPSFQSCEVENNVRVPCGAPDISAAACEAISCCFDGRQCYFGKAVTVQCTKDAQFIVVVARDATLPNIDLDSISLLGAGQGCTHIDSNSEFAIYQFPVTACGSIVMEEPGVIIYENRMSSSFEVGVGYRGAITRDSYYDFLFQCRYIGTSVETLVTEVLPIETPPLGAAAWGPIEVQLRLANGQCHTKGCNELDVAYTSFYTNADYPVTKVLRDPVYVEVQLMGKTDPNLVLTLGRCWTTTSSNPHSLPQWDILIDGCPYQDDRYMSSLVPCGSSSGLDFPSHYRRFLFKMFTFVDSSSMVPLREQVYIHCSAAVCTAAHGYSCEPSCYRNKRDVKAVEQRKAEPKVVVSVGPVNMGSPEQ